MVTPSGKNIAGLTYNLTCTASVNGSSEAPTFQWQHNNIEVPSQGDSENRSVVSGMESGSPYTSVLQFSPAQQSHTGTYTCIVSVGGVSANSSVNVTIAGMLVIKVQHAITLSL